LSRVYFTDRDLGKQFPEILRAGGLDVRRHADFFPPACADEVWLEDVGQRQWVALTHDRRLRYKPNERAAVIRHKVMLLVVIGHAPFPGLARSFLATLGRIEAFLDQHSPPFIAKVYRPPSGKLARKPNSSGSIEYWYP
jgi:hypothetical protein